VRKQENQKTINDVLTFLFNRMGAVGFFFKLAMKIRVGITTSDLLILYCTGINWN
jgi:hypothetical protein